MATNRGGKRPGSGRKPLPKELQYLEAVKRGAPLSKVTKAVASVLDRAQRTGDPKALSSVLQFLVPMLSHTDTQLSGTLDLNSIDVVVHNGDNS